MVEVLVNRLLCFLGIFSPRAKKEARSVNKDLGLISAFTSLPTLWEVDLSSSFSRDAFSRVFGQRDFDSLRKYFQELLMGSTVFSEDDRVRISYLLAIQDLKEKVSIRTSGLDSEAWDGSVFDWLGSSIDPESGKTFLALLSTTDLHEFQIGFIAVENAVFRSACISQKESYL